MGSIAASQERHNSEGNAENQEASGEDEVRGGRVNILDKWKIHAK